MAATLTEQQRRVLVSMGYNPDEAQDASLEEFYGQQQPTLSNPEQPSSIKAKPSVGGVLVRQAGTSIGPTAAGFAAGGKVTAATAPILGPWAVIPGLVTGIVTGVATSYLQKKAIKALAPQFAEQLQQDVEQRPVVSAAGSLLGSGVIVKPDPRAIIGAGKAIRALTTGGKPVAADIGNLVNVGTGAGIPAAQEGYAAVTGKDVDPAAAALNIVGGALLNNPNRIGRALGGTANTYSTPDISLTPEQVRAKGPLVENTPLPATQGDSGNILLDALYSKALETKLNPDVLARPGELTPKIAKEAAIPELQTPDPVAQDNAIKLADKKLAARIEKAEAESAGKAETVAAELGKPNTKSLDYESEIATMLDKPLQEKALPTSQRIPLSKETPPLKLKQEYGREMKTALEQNPEQILQGLNKKGISSTPTEAWVSTMERLGQARDIGIAHDGNLVSTKTGKPIAGVAYLRDTLGNALAKVNPKLAGLDTWPHELTHIFIDDLANGPSKLGQKIVKDGHSIVAQSPEFIKAKAANPELTPHEFLTQGVGEDVVRRLLSTDDKGKFGNWLQDFWSFAKHKFGKGTQEDYKRLLSNKLLIDAPASETKLSGSPTTVPQESQESYLKQQQNAEIQRIIAKVNSGKKLTDAEVRIAERLEYPPGTHPSVGSTDWKKAVTEWTEKIYREQNGSPLKEGDVKFAGLQPGFAEIGLKGWPMYNIENKAGLNEKLVFGSTVSRKTLQDAGYQIPKSELIREAAAELDHIADFTRAEFDMMYKEGGYTKEAVRLGETVKSNPELVAKLEDLKTGALLKQQSHIANNDIEGMLLEGDKSQFFSEAYGAATETGSGGETAKLISGDTEHITKLAKEQYEQTVSSLGPVGGPVVADSDVSVPVLRSAIEKIAVHKSPEAKILSDKFTDFYEALRANRGEFINGLTRPLKDILGLRFNGTNFKDYILQNNESAQKVLDFMSGKSNIKLNADEQKAVDLIDNIIKRVQAEQAARPDITIDVPDFSTGNLMDVMTRYLDKVSRRLANYDIIRTPEVANALKTDLGKSSEVQTVLRDIQGAAQNLGARQIALGYFTRSLMLGPLTGARDYVSNITIGMQHMDSGQVLKAYVDATANIGKNLAESFKAGVNRENISSIELGDDGTGNLIKLLRRGRDIISDVQGRNWLEQVTRATAYGQGKFLALDNMFQYSQGKLSKQGERFLDKFHPDKNWRNNKTGQLTPEEIQKIAGRYTESVQGTYDLRGLPHFMVEGPLSQVFSLAKWNVEKTNNFMKHVITPAVKHGDYRPLIMQTLGMFIGGAAVTKLTELITKRRDKHASVAEIKQADSKEQKITSEMFYKILGLVSASGYGGILGEVTHNIMDKVYGKNKPLSYNNAFLELADNLSDNLVSVIHAIDEGAGPEIVVDALTKAVEDNVQMVRLAASYIDKDKIDKIDRGNKYRDLRTFNRLYDKPISDLSNVTPDNDLVNKETKTFKRTDDLKEAAKLLPNLIKKAVVDAKGDPDRLRANLSSLKKNSYQTMPSPDTFPTGFLQYVTFLKETQGEEAAKERLMDFLKQREVNKMKNELIPTP